MSCLQPEHGEYASGSQALRHFVLDQELRVMTPHKHELPHTVVVYEGELLAKTWCETGCGEEKEKVFKTGDSFLIDAHWMHVFSALTDVAKGVCIFPARDPELKGSVIDYSGW